MKEKTAMTQQKTYDRQTAKFLAVVGENMPAEMSGDSMQEWIQNPKELQKALRYVFGSSLQVAPASPEHLIDLDAAPFTPSGWKVEEHQKGGQFKWDASKVNLYLSKKQKGSNYIEGNKLREELKGQPVYNANLLDYLLKNPHLIPEEWKGKYVFFWGTIYRHSDGGLCVRCLYWSGGRWDWGNGWLGYDWSGDDPAAVPAS